MGYESKELLVKTISQFERYIIKLEPGVLSLSEAVVTAKKKRKLSAKRIVRRAINAIPRNYAENTFSTIGYYRDYQRENEDYVNLNEAILEVFDPGFDQLDDPLTKVRLYQYKRNTSFKRNKIADRPYDYVGRTKTIPDAYLPSYGGNEFVLLRVHDAIRNYKVNSYDFINKLETDFLGNHLFKKVEDTYFEGEYLYTIEFKKRFSKYQMKGKLLIAKGNFAIYKLEYAMYRNGAMGNASFINVANNLIFSVVNEYREKHGRMYLNYISFQNIFQLAEPPEFIVQEVIADKKRRFFEVRFSKNIDAVSARNKNNYKFKYLGDRIKFKDVVVLDDKVRLYPDMEAAEIDGMITLINDALQSKDALAGLFDTQVKGLRTVSSNGEFIRLNEGTLKNYHQFREFFVQEVKPNVKLINDSLYMNKQKPIFKDQPIVKLNNFDEYWMNTPLKTVKN